MWVATLLAAVLAVGCGSVSAAAQGAATPAASEATGSPATCRIGISLTSLHDLNVETETFEAEFWIWSLCPDDSYHPLRTMEFVNADSTTMSMEGEDDVDGVHWTYAKVQGVFRHHWDLAVFPFDRPELQIIMEDADSYASDFVYAVDNGEIHEPDMHLDGWRILDSSLVPSVHTYHTAYGDPARPDGTSAYPRLTLTDSLARSELTSFVKLTFLVYIAFVISLISYFIPPSDPILFAGRLTITSATLFTVALSLRAASTDLNSADRLTLVDWIHIVALAAILLDAIASLVTWLMVKHGRSTAEMDRFTYIMMTAVLVGFVAINVVLIAGAAIV
jgi:hypothetical protein